MTIWKAIIVGQLVVNVPVAIIIVAVTFVGAMIVPWPFALLGASLIAWIWWSFTIARWRNWAIRNGCDPDRLQKFGVRTGLTWPKGSPFARTEFGPKD
jgi:hypothetical protein